MTPLECERLMGFPDNYTNLEGAKFTSRYQATGNSWSVPVVQWIGKRLVSYLTNQSEVIFPQIPDYLKFQSHNALEMWAIGKEVIQIGGHQYLNGSLSPCEPRLGNMMEIIDIHASEKLYITPVGCKGILRRKEERGMPINPRLEEVLREISSTWTDAEIEVISRKQARGRFSTASGGTSKVAAQSAITPNLWEE